MIVQEPVCQRYGGEKMRDLPVRVSSFVDVCKKNIRRGKSMLTTVTLGMRKVDDMAR